MNNTALCWCFCFNQENRNFSLLIIDLILTYIETGSCLIMSQLITLDHCFSMRWRFVDDVHWNTRITIMSPQWIYWITTTHRGLMLSFLVFCCTLSTSQCMEKHWLCYYTTVVWKIIVLSWQNIWSFVYYNYLYQFSKIMKKAIRLSTFKKWRDDNCNTFVCSF